jgi:hypothetical protein
MISVHETENLSLQQIEKFLEAANEVRFEASEREAAYGWIERLLCQQEYVRQGRRVRGLLRRYIAKMTGLSRAQLTRLVVVEFARSDPRGVFRRNFSPTFLQLSTRETVLLPDDFKLRLEPLCKLFGPGPEREAGGHVADGAALHWVKPFHVRPIPFERDILIGRFAIHEHDVRSADILVEIACQVEYDP